MCYSNRRVFIYVFLRLLGISRFDFGRHYTIVIQTRLFTSSAQATVTNWAQSCAHIASALHYDYSIKQTAGKTDRKDYFTLLFFN